MKDQMNNSDINHVIGTVSHKSALILSNQLFVEVYSQ